MNGLQEAFYIIGIIFMGLMLILTLALIAAVFVIRSKINKIHHAIETKLEMVSTIAEKGGELAAFATSGIAKKAKQALRHKR